MDSSVFACRRCHLEHINEADQMSIAGTELSLEWFEEGLAAALIHEQQQGEAVDDDDGRRFEVGSLNLDFDQASLYSR